MLLRPEDCWVELWLPATSPLERGDVRVDGLPGGRVVGRWRSPASASTAEAHRGALRDADQGAVACFAGLGPGELTVRGRKLVGLSQWRSREGALVSSVLAARPPVELAAYLAAGDTAVPKLELATSLTEALPGVAAEHVSDAFCRAVLASLPTLAPGAALLSPDLSPGSSRRGVPEP